MKKEINVLKYSRLCYILSLSFILVGIVFFIIFGGFNKGIDFGSGFSEQIQIAPLGLEVSYSGDKSAILSISNNTLVLQLRDSYGVDETVFVVKDYPTTKDLGRAMEEKGLTVVVNRADLKVDNLVSGYGFPALLSEKTTRLNFQTDTADVTTEDLRKALGEEDVKVQSIGSSFSGIFKLRLTLKENETQEEAEARIFTRLAPIFGEENIVIESSDYVGPKFSASLLKSSILAILIAIVLILIYIAIRFRLAYALSSIAALAHDVLMMLSFVVIFRLEISSTTIAAVLTIIGYSLNNTIVIFDRVRENLKVKKPDVIKVINKSINESFSRTIITTLTTLLAIVPLAIFSSGDIKLFAINLVWGLIVGAYSSSFIAPSLLLFFHKFKPIDVIKEKKEEEYSLVD